MKRFLLAVTVLVAALLFATPASARNRAYGFCEIGDKTVVVSGLNGAPDVQASYPGCTVTVYLTGTLTLATLFSDDAGTPQANPFTASSTTGYWFFYADDGRYDVRISGAGITTPFTFGDVSLGGSGTGGGLAFVTQAFSATPTFDANGVAAFQMTLTGNVTSSTVTNPTEAQQLGFVICQDATGARTFAWPANFLNPPTVIRVASYCTRANFTFDGTNWHNFGPQQQQTWKGPQPWRDVTDYGAVGNGSTNDAAAIQAAVNDACASGGSVRFPTSKFGQPYVVNTTITVPLASCQQLHLVGAAGQSIMSQFGRAPRAAVRGSAAPIFEMDNSMAGADDYITFENLDISSTGGIAVKAVGLPFLWLKNVGIGSNYDSMLTRSAPLLMEGSILWFKAEDSNFSTNSNNTGPFNPTPPKTYDPNSWTPPAALMYANSSVSGSILFYFDNVTWAHGGFKVTVADNAGMVTGETFGEIIFNMNVLEGQFASPLLQFENAQSATGVGVTATLSRVFVNNSQLADVAHPTPLVSVKGTGNHTASIGSIFFLQSLSHMDCYVLGINGQENIAGIWADTPQDAAYSCTDDGFPGENYSMIKHSNFGLDVYGPFQGPLNYRNDNADGGPFRTFIPNGTTTLLSATSMRDNDGTDFYGPGGEDNPFDLATHRTDVGEWSLSVPVHAPTMFTAMAAAGGSIPDGTWFLCVAAGDRNNSPFTVSECSSEATVVLGGGNNTIDMTWVDVPINSGNKYTVYIGPTMGGENKAQNYNAGSPQSLNTMPAPNQTPQTASTLLADVWSVDADGFQHKFNTSFFGRQVSVPTANRTWTWPDASITVPGNFSWTCGTAAAGSSATCAETNISTTFQEVIGTVALSSGTPSTATITSMPPFSGTNNYGCNLTNMTADDTGGLQFVPVSATSFTIEGPDTVTDVVFYSCKGTK